MPKIDSSYKCFTFFCKHSSFINIIAYCTIVCSVKVSKNNVFVSSQMLVHWFYTYRIFGPNLPHFIALICVFSKPCRIFPIFLPHISKVSTYNVIYLLTESTILPEDRSSAAWLSIRSTSVSNGSSHPPAWTSTRVGWIRTWDYNRSDSICAIWNRSTANSKADITLEEDGTGLSQLVSTRQRRKSIDSLQWHWEPISHCIDTRWFGRTANAWTHVGRE